MDQEKRRFIIADDHPLFRAALKEALMQTFGEVEILEASSFDTLQEAVFETVEPDLVLLDLCMPGVRGFSGLIFLRGHFPAWPVIVVSANEDPVTVASAINYGASGFIPKSSSMDQISEGIHAVLEGDIWVPDELVLNETQDQIPSKDHEFAKRLSSLTPKQFAVLNHIVDGLLNKQIADIMSISEATVKAHVTAILNKLSVTSRTQVVIAMNQLDTNPRAFD